MAYANEDERREARKRALAKYYASPKGRANIHRKNRSAAHKASAKKYRASEKGKARVKARAQWMLDYKTQEHATNPNIRKARAALNYAVKSGQLVRPATCETCGVPKPVEGHHHLGWEPEHWLDVQWLCARCHRANHQDTHATPP